MPSTLKVTYFFFLSLLILFFFPAGVLKMSYGRDGSEEHVKGRVLKGWQSRDRRSKQMKG